MSRGTEVMIRLPLPVRTYVGAFLVVWFGGLTWTAVTGHNAGFDVIAAVFVAFGATIGWRLLRMSIRSEGANTLTVYNMLGTRRLARPEIEEFRIGSSGVRWGRRGVVALLRDGTVYDLEVSRTPLGRVTRRLTMQVDQLNAWLRDRE